MYITEADHTSASDVPGNPSEPNVRTEGGPRIAGQIVAAVIVLGALGLAVLIFALVDPPGTETGSAGGDYGISQHRESMDRLMNQWCLWRS